MKLEQWKELILAEKGKIPLSQLLAFLLPLAGLRKLSTARGLKLSGGFRVHKAGSDKLAERLAEEALTNDGLRDELARELAGMHDAANSTDITAMALELEKAKSKVDRLTLVVEKTEQKLIREKDSAKKARKSRADVLEKQYASDKRIAGLKAHCHQLERRLEQVSQELKQFEANDQEDKQESMDRAGLERRLAQLAEIDAESRKQIAILSSRERELERIVDDLEALLPRGQKERWRLKKKSLEPLPDVQLLPYFTEAFFRSIEHLSAADVRKIYIAIAQMILMGQDYPGLHLKSLKGMGGLLSARAGMHLRLYFKRDGDGVEFLHAGTREEQPTYLKKFKE